MRITFLGSCSGTEPMPGRHHCSIAMETGGRLYLFDAGEDCAYTAWNLGLDLPHLQRIIISHPHTDHTGGLLRTIGVVNKLLWRQNATREQPLTVHISDPRTMQGIRLILDAACANLLFPLEEQRLTEGLVFDDGNMRVTAIGNRHMAPFEDGSFRSFSFLIEAEGKRIVYTGDVKHISEAASFFPCDFLIMETGHHRACEVCAWLREQNAVPPQMWFNHHGRAMLADPHGEIAAAREAAGSDNIWYSNDGQSVQF